MPFARKRLCAEDRRRSILDEAKRLFAKTGFHGVSVDEIARRVKVSPAILYRHFPSKESLYDAVLEEMSCRREEYVEAIVAEDADFASVLRRITKLYVQGVCREPDYLRMEMQAALEGGSAAVQFFENRWKPFIDFVEIEVNELKAAGRVPATLDPRVAGLLYQGLVREVLYTKCIVKDKRCKDIPPETIVDQAMDLFFRALGIAADP
jgi:AcrR family transcriptional regulator